MSKKYINIRYVSCLRNMGLIRNEFNVKIWKKFNIFMIFQIFYFYQKLQYFQYVIIFYPYDTIDIYFERLYICRYLYFSKINITLDR